MQCLTYIKKKRSWRNSFFFLVAKGTSGTHQACNNYGCLPDLEVFATATRNIQIAMYGPTAAHPESKRLFAAYTYATTADSEISGLYMTDPNTNYTERKTRSMKAVCALPWGPSLLWTGWCNAGLARCMPCHVAVWMWVGVRSVTCLSKTSPHWQRSWEVVASQSQVC